jgi:hypothetical protein
MASSNYYTYAYLRKSDGTPYYIGKGNGRRAFVKHQGISVPKDKSKIIFLKQNLTEEEAFKHEIYMIAVFGRKDLGTGILLNRTNGGDGGSSGRIVTEKQRENSRKNGKAIYEKGVGIHSQTREEKTVIGKKAGKISYEKGVGLFNRSKEKHSEDSKKGIKVTNSQKWQCTETGFTSNAGGLTHYQKKRGIDTSNRIKVDGPRCWEITFDCGKVVVTSETLKDWSDENGYNYYGLISVKSGQCSNHKGIIKIFSL